MLDEISKSLLKIRDEEFIVQCFHCKGKKGRIIKKKGKVWASCPNCGASLDVMNRVTDQTTSVTNYYLKQGLPVPKHWRLRFGDIVLWISPSHTCGYVPDKSSKPNRFVVLHFGKKRTLIRSEDMHKQHFSYQNVSPQTDRLELIERAPIRILHFKKVDPRKTWLRKGIGVNGGGDYIGVLKDNENIKVLMSWKGINGRTSTPAFFEHNSKWYKIPMEEVTEVVIMTRGLSSG